MELQEIMPLLRNTVASPPEELEAATSAVASNLSLQDAVNIVHNVSSALGIKKPLIVPNSNYNGVSSVRGVPIINLTSPIQHGVLINQLQTMVKRERPFPEKLFALGLISAFPAGLISGMIQPEGGIVPALTTLITGLTAAPRVYQDIKMHRLSHSPYTAKEIVTMGKYLAPAIMTANAHFLMRP
jgi:hypothetical protein